MSATDQRLSRRSVIKGAAVGTGAVALAACAPDHLIAGDLNAARVRSVPELDPDDRRWELARELQVDLGPQNVVLPMTATPSVAQIRVRAVHDGERLAVRLEWDDPQMDDLTIRMDEFRDACAVLLAPGVANVVLRTMGSATVPATLLHWKADWQRDVDQGRQGLEAAYPNRSVDVYPPLWNVAPADVDIAAYEKAGATQWLPGIHVANPISGGGRTTPVEKAIAYGFGTTKTGTVQDALGRGTRSASGWRVVISKPLGAADVGEIQLRPGDRVTCAFAVWSGAVHDAGSRKSPSINVYALALES